MSSGDLNPASSAGGSSMPAETKPEAPVAQQQEQKNDAPTKDVTTESAKDTTSSKETSSKPSDATKTAPKDAKAQTPAGEKKLTGAELKAKAKAEKAARRAQTKSAAPAGGPDSQGQAGGDPKNAKTKQKQGNQDKQQSQNASANAKGKDNAPVVTMPSQRSKDHMADVPEEYSHLSMARRLPMTQADKDVHPAVLAVGQQMAAFAITDSTARLKATLLAIKKVIDSYTTPQGNTFSRHFTSHVLNPQIEYLAACRPMCFSMGNAVRWLKLQVSKVDIDLPDIDAKKLICESIDGFLRERVTLADHVIVESAADLIKNDSIVLTYGRHPLVERAIRHAHEEQHKRFRVKIVDDYSLPVGRDLAVKLGENGYTVTYVPRIGNVRIAMKDATVVLVGAEAMFSNGAMYASAGTADVAMMASHFGVTLAALSETINFTERVAMDSLTYNEIDPDLHTADGLRLLFDTTPDKHIAVVITELGNSDSTSVPAILRKLEEL